MTERVALRDGREMIIRPAERSDAQAIAAEHPLPRGGGVPERLYRNYYLAKSLLYIRAPVAGITTAWVGDSLAGFVFHCRDMDHVRNFARSPRALLWFASEVLRGHFGYSLSFWVTALRWGGQHFRQPREYGNGRDAAMRSVPDIQAWIGTVHTIEAYRRQGVATALLAAVEDDLRTEGASEVALWVAADNAPGQALYLKRSYEERGDYFRIGEKCLLMVKPLSPVPSSEMAEATAASPEDQTWPPAPQPWAGRHDGGLARAEETRLIRDDGRPNPGRAVVTDASERVALHVIRALGRAGIEVVATDVVERSDACPGFSSRYARETHVLPSWEQTGSQALARLLEVGREGDVLAPVCLNSLLHVMENSDALSAKFHMLLPSMQAILKANNKWELHQIAVAMGVSVPASWSPADEREVQALAEQVRFPVTVKLRHDQGIFLGPAERYAKVDDAPALRDAWQHFNELQPRPIIQEYIAGEGYGFEALYDRSGRPVATFQHRRLVECPPGGGPSAVCESVRVAELEDQGRTLLDGLGWRGVAMVEFRRCAETGKFYLLEINPRFWGSISLSEAAGVNFPELYYRCARGEDVEPSAYREGVRLRFLPTYLTSMAMSLRRGGPGFRQVGRQLAYLVDPRVREGLMSWDDPGGSWAYVWKNLRGGRGG